MANQVWRNLAKLAFAQHAWIAWICMMDIAYAYNLNVYAQVQVRFRSGG